MSVKTSCISCGVEVTHTEPSSKCPKCGKPISVAKQASSAPMTIIENVDPSGRTNATVAAKPTECPRSIDGYEIISLLGSGGMGSVFLAYEPLLDREVALKLLSQGNNSGNNDAMAARFLSEAVLTGKLGHAGIIPIHHVGFDARYGYYYTMRYIKGESLADILQKLRHGNAAEKDKYTRTKLLTIFLKVCQALGFAHNHGVVHRDIKPANIMIADFGEVLVLDWGLAKQTKADEISTAMAVDQNCSNQNLRAKHGTSSQLFLLKGKKTGGTSYLKSLQSARPGQPSQPLTQANHILGTPGYLSPEQAIGETNVTPASDVYSLGVMLYELLTLQLPLDTHDTNELITHTAIGRLIPIRKRDEAARLPNALCDIVARALETDPNKRFADAKELAEEISDFLEGRPAFKTLLAEEFSAPLSKSWRSISGNVEAKDNCAWLPAGSRLRCEKVSIGDFCCEMQFWSATSSGRWVLKLGVFEEAVADEPRYEVRIGIQERSFIELIRNGKRVLRRFEIGIQANQKYAFKLELEEAKIRVWIDGRKLIDYSERFPQAGGFIECGALFQTVCIDKFRLLSRGAPLQLSFMALPDRLYRAQRFSEARELYRQLASSHPDREEGLMATYKAGLCSTGLQDLQAAFEEFSRLEGTMLDHCCALGLAKIGMCDGNIDWAWESLKNGYRKYPSDDVRGEMWFSLLSLVENLDSSRNQEKIDRYMELLGELQPEGHEVSQLTFNLMELIYSTHDVKTLRSYARTLLEKFGGNEFVQAEVLLSLSRAGIDHELAPLVADALDELIASGKHATKTTRFHIMRAEMFISQSEFTSADLHLRDAIHESGLMSSQSIWAKGWQILLMYLRGDYQMALTQAHEAVVRCRRLECEEIGLIHMLEALAYFGKKQNAHAMSALNACCERQSIWGKIGNVVISKADLPTALDQLKDNTPSLISEALFFIAEARKRLSGAEEAKPFYRACFNHPIDRAMFVTLSRNALLEMERTQQ